MAVVKADAYGHGLLPSARAALRGGATWLGVAQLPEAVELRRAGIEAPLLSWLHVPGQDFVKAVKLGIDLGISTTWALDQVLAAATVSGQTARVHLKVDTGLGRNGAWDADLEALLATARVGAGRAGRRGRRAVQPLRLCRRPAAPDGQGPAGAVRGDRRPGRARRDPTRRCGTSPTRRPR